MKDDIAKKKEVGCTDNLGAKCFVQGSRLLSRLGFFFLAIYLLTACTAPSGGSDAPLRVTPPDDLSIGLIAITQDGAEKRAIREEVVYLDNCDGTAELTSSVSRTRNVVHVTETGGTETLPAQLGSLLQESIATQLGFSPFSTNQESSITLTAAPGRTHAFTVRTSEVWTTGTATLDYNGRRIVLPYRFRSDIELQLVGVQDLECSVAVDIPTATPETLLETIEDANSGDSNKAGNLEVEYPVTMSPRSSDAVFVSISIPDSLSALEPTSIARVDIPVDESVDIGKLSQYRAAILVSELLRVELSSPSFEIEPLHPAIQAIDAGSPGSSTDWAWTIKAPVDLGQHLFSLRVYFSENQSPVWAGVFRVDVTDFSPIPLPDDNTLEVTESSLTPVWTVTPALPTPTPTPIPILQRITNQVVDNFSEIVVALIALAGVIATAWVAYQKILQDSKRGSDE